MLLFVAQQCPQAQTVMEELHVLLSADIGVVLDGIWQSVIQKKDTFIVAIQIPLFNPKMPGTIAYQPVGRKITYYCGDPGV